MCYFLAQNLQWLLMPEVINTTHSLSNKDSPATFLSCFVPMKILHLSYHAPAELDQSYLPEWIPWISASLLCLWPSLYLESIYSHPSVYLLHFTFPSRSFQSATSFIHFSPTHLNLSWLWFPTEFYLFSLHRSVSGFYDSYFCVWHIPSPLNDGLLEGCNMLSHRAFTFFNEKFKSLLFFSHNQMYAHLLKKIKHYKNTSLRKWDPPL